MKYAEYITDIPNAFSLRPLEQNSQELEDFFCDDSMQYRTGHKYNSPIQDIFEACQMPSESNVFLLLGHTGCGKSTELNKMATDLQKKGYMISTIKCGVDLDLFNPVFSDLLILMGETLLGTAKKVGCKLSHHLEERLISYWTTEITETSGSSRAANLLVESGIKAGTPTFLAKILDVFVQVKDDLRFATETRDEYRRKITNRTSEWLSMIKEIADIITEKLCGMQPTLIFEDLDKIVDLDKAYEIFSNHATALTAIPFPVIYTFPIALSYDPRFASLEGYYKTKILPMIKLETVGGIKYPDYRDGVDLILRIIKKRADLSLFEDNVLLTLILKTGGSLRDLFSCINTAATITFRRKSESISMDDADVALKEVKSLLTRRIDQKNYEFLADIYKGNHQKIENKPMLLEMLRANAVLEYNSTRWHNTHPLVAEFLIEQGLSEK